MKSFHLNASQKKSNLWIGGLTALGLMILAGILSQVAADEETGTNLCSVAIGLTTGVLVRISTKRGWRYAMAETASPAPFAWNAKRRIGVMWRSVAAFFAGRLIMGGLGALASGDTALALLMAFALIVITVGAILVGLRYGWKEAQTSLQAINQANVTP